MSPRTHAWDGKPRRTKIWTSTKLKKLKTLYSEGEPNWKIAKTMQVSINAVNSQLGILRKEGEIKRPKDKKIIRRSSHSKREMTPQQIYQLKKRVEKLSKDNKRLRKIVSKIKRLTVSLKK